MNAHAFLSRNTFVNIDQSNLASQLSVNIVVAACLKSSAIILSRFVNKITKKQRELIKTSTRNRSKRTNDALRYRLKVWKHEGLFTQFFILLLLYKLHEITKKTAKLKFQELQIYFTNLRKMDQKFFFKLFPYSEI